MKTKQTRSESTHLAIEKQKKEIASGAEKEKLLEREMKARDRNKPRRKKNVEEPEASGKVLVSLLSPFFSSSCSSCGVCTLSPVKLQTFSPEEKKPRKPKSRLSLERIRHIARAFFFGCSRSVGPLSLLRRKSLDTPLLSRRMSSFNPARRASSPYTQADACRHAWRKLRAPSRTPSTREIFLHVYTQGYICVPMWDECSFLRVLEGQKEAPQKKKKKPRCLSRGFCCYTGGFRGGQAPHRILVFSSHCR